uniref:Methyltransferase domain-containing protein n=1 Tax=Setaria digitata TaxID=48799 RepID=A0A915PQT6_9BILA
MRLALWEARHAAGLKNYDDAARFYMTLFNDLQLEDRKKYLDEFVAVLEEMGSASGGNDYSKQIMLLLESRVLFPHEAAVLNASAKFFFVVGRLLEAFDFAQEAANGSEGLPHIYAIVNLENIKSNIMDQWHWAMLNDVKRNTAYATAIELVANWKPESRVLDIGTGTGLLTSIARRHFKRDVYCCEVDLNMCDIAEKILNATVIRKHSSEVTIEDVGSEKVDVIITETMDCGLLGEGIACTLYDVQTRILSSSPVIVPRCATVYACIIESPAIMDEHVAVFCGHRFASDSVTASYSSYGATEELEPYWCCSAAEIRGGYKILSKKIEIFAVNFDSRAELDKIVNEGTVELRMAPIIRDGTAHCIMAWFSCELFPGAPRLDTSPEASSCWQQALYPLPKPVNLHRGSICTLKVKAYKDQLLCALRDIVIPEDPGIAEKSGLPCSSIGNSTSSKEKDSNQGLSDKDESFVLPSKRTKHDYDTSASMIISYKNYASPDTIIVLPNNDFAMMNDKYLIHFFKRSLAGIKRREGILDENRNIYILDMTNLGSLSINLVNAYPEMQFSCYNNDAHKLMHLFSPHVHHFGAFPDNQDSLIADESTAENGCPVISSKPPRTYFEDTGCADVLLCWPISSHGFLLETSLNRILSFRFSNKQAQIIPSKISVMGQIVSCADIVHRSKPCPSAYQGVDLSPISDLAISFYYDIEPSVLKHELFSDSFELITFRLDKPMPSNRSEMPEFICLTEVASEAIISADGIAEGLLFWFDVESGKQTYSARSSNTLARCALYLFDESRKVSKGDRLRIKSSCYHGNLAFEVTSSD